MSGPPGAVGELSAVVASNRGLVRPANEDRVGAFGWIAPEQADPIQLRVRPTGPTGPAVVAVADGLGGHPMGERASWLAMRWLMDAAPGLTSPQAVAGAFTGIHERLLADAAQDRGRAGMGTTLAAVVVLGDEFVLANVGDSRVYHVEPGLVDQLTDDDVTLGGALTQCLGGLPGTTVRPAVATFAVDAAARLLLCTDGLHGAVSRGRLREVLGEPDPFACVEGLLAASFEAGAPDNVSLCLLTFQTRPDSQTSEDRDD